MSHRPAKLYSAIPEIEISTGTILVDVDGNLAWNLNSRDEKTGKHIILASGAYGKDILRKMMNKYNLSYATESKIHDFQNKGLINI